MFKYSFFFAILLFISSCAIQKSRIFKIPRGTDYVFDTLSPEMNKEYKIAVDDQIKFTVLTNNGEGIFLGNVQDYGTGTFTIKKDGTTYIPLLGNMYLLGRSVNETEELLRKEFSKYVNDPYIKLEISNSRVIIFKGLGSAASIVKLENAHTTILEVIALSGGIPDRGNSKKIKLVRMVDGIRKIYIIDLSTIDKIENGDMLVQANDYIYIESEISYIQEFAKEFQQFMTPLSVIITSVTLYKTYLK